MKNTPHSSDETNVSFAIYAKKEPLLLFNALMSYFSDVSATRLDTKQRSYARSFQQLVTTITQNMKKGNPDEKLMKAMQKVVSYLKVYKTSLYELKNVPGMSQEQKTDTAFRQMTDKLRSLRLKHDTSACRAVMRKTANDIVTIESYVPSAVEKQQRDDANKMRIDHKNHIKHLLSIAPATLSDDDMKLLTQEGYRFEYADFPIGAWVKNDEIGEDALRQEYEYAIGATPSTMHAERGDTIRPRGIVPSNYRISHGEAGTPERGYHSPTLFDDHE